MVLMLNVMGAPLKESPQIGSGTGVTEDETSDNEGVEDGLATDVKSLDGVKTVAKETVEFFERLAYGDDKGTGNSLTNLKTKWENAASYLQSEQNNAAGATYYNELSALFTEVTGTRAFADVGDFNARVPALLAKLEAAVPQDNAEGLFPVLTSASNIVSLICAVLRCRRSS